MSTVTVSITLQDNLLAEIDAEAKRESRTRSELFREAARVYVERQRRWASLFYLGDGLQRRAKVAERTVASEILEYRAGR